MSRPALLFLTMEEIRLSKIAHAYYFDKNTDSPSSCSPLIYHCYLYPIQSLFFLLTKRVHFPFFLIIRGLDQWFSNSAAHNNHLGQFFKNPTAARHPK